MTHGYNINVWFPWAMSDFILTEKRTLGELSNHTHGNGLNLKYSSAFTLSAFITNKKSNCAIQCIGYL